MGHRGPQCSICHGGRSADEIEEINEVLYRGLPSGRISFRDFDPKYSRKPEIAQRFNLAKDTVARHARACLALNLNPALIGAARKRTEHSSMTRILNAAITTRKIPLGSAADHLRLHEARASEMDAVKQEARAVKDQRLFIAADAALGEIANSASRIAGIDKTGTVNIDARTINVSGASPEFMREYIRAVRAGDPVPAFPAAHDAPAIEGEVVAA